MTQYFTISTADLSMPPGRIDRMKARSECLALMFESLAEMAGIRYQAMMPNLRAEMAGGGGSGGALSSDKPATATTPKPMPADALKPGKPAGLPTLPGW